MSTSATRTDEDRLACIEARLLDGSARMDRMEAELSANTAITVQVRDLLQALRGGLRVLGWLGVAAKWIGGIAAAVTAVWALIHALIHSGRPPHP